MTKETQSVLESLTEQFASEGYEGRHLMERVFAAGYVLSVAYGLDDAAKHFRARLAEVAN